MITKARAALPRTLWLILAVAFALRLLGAWRANLVFDERAHLALADTISLQPGRIHLVSRSLDHPFLSIYILKISNVLFGSSNLGLRILYVLAGTLTVLCMYALGRRVFGQRAGLWAAALLAVDQFHASWSRVFMPEVWLLLFTTLALWQCIRALDEESTKNFVVLGALLGLAYLAKEPGILLVPALWLALLIAPETRRILFQPRWYLAHAVFLLVILPDVAWNVSQWTDSYLHRGAAFLSEPWQVSLKSFSLYVGEVFQVVVGPNVLDSDYHEGGLYACTPIAGVLYLAGVLAALPTWRAFDVRVLLAVFSLVFAVFTLLPGGARFDPFWWASVSLIPAIVCAGGLIDRITGSSPVTESHEGAGASHTWFPWRRPIPGVVAVLLTGYLALHYVPLAWKPGPFVPRPTVADLVRNFSNVGDAAVKRGLLDMATLQYIYVLNIGGPNRKAYLGLAQIAELRGDQERAATLRARAAALDLPQVP